MTTLQDTIRQLDDRLFTAVKDIDILGAVAPLNYREQKAAFFASNFSRNPSFVYARHDVASFYQKRDLFNLPIESLQDEDLVHLYSGVIESYVDKIDQYRSIGTPDFLYDSLRYYGEPSQKDLRNAHFILHLPEEVDSEHDAILNAGEMRQELERFAQQQGYQYSIRLDDNMIANALVSGTTIKINSAARVSETEVRALAHHELGVHLVTTLNGRAQPLKILSMGCPVNTMTQEGLAIFCEYLAGFMTLSRLKILALRVLAVDSMIEDKDFKKTFLLLKEQYGASDEQAFTITARVYRGGGLTKDYLYLQGFHQMLNAYEHRDDFSLLLAGKVSLDYLDVIRRLIDKGLLLAPKLISPSILKPAVNDSIRQFIAHAIK